jgi:hypothetical protein
VAARLAGRPGLRELLLFGVAYLLYSLGRFVAIGDVDGALRAAAQHVLATWLIALPIDALFPVAPPRLADIGLVDTITTQTGVALDSKLTTSMFNEYAAVPSLRAGFALAVSVVLGPVATRRRWRILAWCPSLLVDRQRRQGGRRSVRPHNVDHAPAGAARSTLCVQGGIKADDPR